DYLRDHEVKEEDTYLAYFGTVDPIDYGIHSTRLDVSRPLPVPPLKGGLYCASVTALQSTFTHLPGKWTHEREAQYQKFLKHFGVNPPESGHSGIGEWLARYGDLRSAR